MKTLISFFALFLSLFGLAQQPQLGMSTSYTISPSSALSSNPGIAYSNTISITCKIINKGTTSFSTGIVSLMRVVKTGTFTSTSSTIYTGSVSTVAPGDSVTVTATDSIIQQYYRVNGNGNTIVVWPVAPNAITRDSLQAGPVYTSDPTGIEELDRYKLFIYPNPASQKLFIRPETGKHYKELSIYDMQLKMLMRRPFEESTDIGELPPGTYIISVSDSEGRIYSSRFVKNN